VAAGVIVLVAASLLAPIYVGFHAFLISRIRVVYFDPAETWQNLWDRV
jgi:hypothetical protein